MRIWRMQSMVTPRLLRLMGVMLCVAPRAVMLAQVYKTAGNQPTRMSLEDHILKETSVEPVECVAADRDATKRFKRDVQISTTSW
jgi:hypothetical protein